MLKKWSLAGDFIVMGGTSIENKDFYQILNVPREATVDQIRESYKEIAKIYHPDSNFYSEIIKDAVKPEEVSVFKAITAAYNTLVNEETRKAYDRTLLQGILPDWDGSPKSSDAARPDFETVRIRRTAFGKPPPSAFDTAEEQPKPKEQPKQTASREIPAVAIHVALGLGVGGLVGLVVLFALGYL